MHDKEGAKRVLGGIKFRMPRLRTIWADNGYAGEDLAGYVSEDGYEIKVVKRTQRSFVVQPKRWIVERTFAWMDQNRRMSKDYERHPQTSEALMEIAMTRLMLRRWTKHKTF